MHTHRRLPPLNTLWVFLTASRLLSFTKAADELYITRSAVSRQIKNLEEYFGFQLFERHKVGLELTEKGMAYANSISSIFADLKVATNALQHNSDDLKLKLGISATFNATWLMPKLANLESTHPELALSFYTNSVDTGQESIDFSGDMMDAAIRLGSGTWSGCHSIKLTDINVQPVCSPTLLDGLTDTPLNIRDAKTLAGFNWLHYSHLPELWPQWLSACGAGLLKTSKRDIVFDNVAVATQAAVDGLGIIPMYLPLANPLIDEGKLVVAHEYFMQKADSYYFVCPEAYQNNKAICLFRDWILNESVFAE